MSENLTVLHTIAGLKRQIGGTSTVVSALCESLGRSGATVHLAAQDCFHSADDNILPDVKYVNTRLIQTVHIPLLGITYSPFYTAEISRLCKKQRIQIIHDNGLWLHSNHASASIARRLRLPLIIQPHGMLEPWALSYRAWKKQLAWKLYQRRDLQSTTLLVATSNKEADGLQRVGLRQPIAIIPNGVDIPSWKEHPIAKDGERYALFLSRIHPVKGLLNLVAAWASLRPEGWRMVVAGPDKGNHLVEVETAVQRAGLEQNFDFVGHVAGAAKEKLYREADLFILPTFSENFAMVVAEALSYGVPAITTKGAPWEGLVDHRCGWWVDVGVKPLAEAFRVAVEMSDAERQEMGKRGRRFVEAKYSWPCIAADMLAVYKWILKLEGMPCCVRLD
jgi:glycosyltransferase involved in cell wall biosynthesis